MAQEPKYPVTQAIHFLKQHSVAYTPALYRYEGRGEVAKTAAAAIEAPEEEVYKTLVFQCEGDAMVVLMDASGTVSLSKLAAVTGHKEKATPCQPRDAERLSGYQVGGISPFGTRQKMRVVVDELALLQDKIWVNGGSHGFLIQVETQRLVEVLTALVADVRQ